MSIAEHLPGKHNQKTHGGGGALGHGDVDALSEPDAWKELPNGAQQATLPDGRTVVVGKGRGPSYNKTHSVAIDGEVHGAYTYNSAGTSRFIKAWSGKASKEGDNAAYFEAPYDQNAYRTGARQPFWTARAKAVAHIINGGLSESLAEHLPGKHNQLAHGRKGSVSGDVGRTGGGSYAASGAPLTTGAVVAIPGHAMSVDAERFTNDAAFRRATIREWQRKNPGSQFGVWDSSREGGRDIVFDRIENVSRARAIELGRQRGEDGIFDLDKMEYVPTGGSTYVKEAEANVTTERTFIAAFDPPPPDATDDELDAWADTIGDHIVASMPLSERAYVRDRRGRFSPTGGRGTAGPLQDSSERNMVGGAYTAERTRLHDSIIANAQKGIPTHPGEQVAVFTGGGAASGKSTMLKEQLVPNGLAPRQGDFVNVNADLVKNEIPDFVANKAAGKPYAAWDSHEESSHVSKRMYRESIASGRHVVYDSVGDNGAASVSKKVGEMRANGATRVDGHYATVHPKTAAARAKARSQDPSSDSFGRKVDEAEIYRQHRDVSKTWLDLASSGTFDHLTLWDNNGAKGSAPKLIAEARGGTVTVHDSGAFGAFTSYASWSG